MANQLPPVEELRALFQYDPDRGALVWKSRPNAYRNWNARYAGRDAGQHRADGYTSVTLGGRRYYAHRIIWKLCSGNEPSPLLDHRDGDQRNNRIENLREATSSQNMMNQRAWGTMPKGVYLHRKTGKYCARIHVGGRCRHIGYFRSAEDAAAAYKAAADKHFEQFSRPA